MQTKEQKRVGAFERMYKDFRTASPDRQPRMLKELRHLRDISRAVRDYAFQRDISLDGEVQP